MQDTFAKIKNAIDFNSGDHAMVAVKDRMMYGTTGHVTAGAPIDIDLEFMVAAASVQKYLGTSPNPVVKVTDKSLTFTHGSHKGRFPLLDKPAFWEKIDHTQPRVEVKPGFNEVLRILAPFIEEDYMNPWRCGIVFANGHAYAATRDSMVKYDYACDEDFILPLRGLKYLLSRSDDVTHISVTPRYIIFYLEDGSWASCTRVPADDEKLDRIPTAVDRHYVAPNSEIPQELKSALAKIFETRCEVVEINPEGVKSELMAGVIAVEGDFKVLTETVWTAKALEVIMQHATHMSLDAFTEDQAKPACFSGDKILGAIVRRAKVCNRQDS